MALSTRRWFLPVGALLFPLACTAKNPSPEAPPSDTVTTAPELVRMSLNMAMAHTDARFSYLGERLVYGGHVIFMAFAQATRALPNLLTILAWDSCDHTAPVLENDRLRTEVGIVEVVPAPRGSGGSLLRLHVESFAARGAIVAGTAEQETKVLDWKFWAWGL